MCGYLFGVIQPNVPTSSRFMSRPSGLVVHCGRTITGKLNYSALLGVANNAGVRSHALAPQIGTIANWLDCARQILLNAFAIYWFTLPQNGARQFGKHRQAHFGFACLNCKLKCSLSNWPLDAAVLALVPVSPSLAD